jgi:hypothetical protein
MSLTPQAAAWEAARRAPLRPPVSVTPHVVDGWFPHISTTGRIVSGFGAIYLDNATYVDDGWTPKWIDANTIVYNTGSVSRVRNVTTSAITDIPFEANRYAADGGVWQALQQSGPIYLNRYTGVTLSEGWTGRGQPSVAPNGDWANADNFAAETHTVYRNGAAVYGPAAVLDVSLSTAKTCVLLAVGSTRRVLVLPDIDCSVETWEGPLLLDGPPAEPDWVLSLLQTGLILRPVGASEGYRWSGTEFYNPWARYVGGVFTIAFSSGAGVPGTLTVNPVTDPRVALGPVMGAYDTETRLIRRLRRAPHVATPDAHRRVCYRRFALDLERGVGLVDGQGVDPTVMLRVSRDGGHTWSEPWLMPAGRLGEYSRRVLARRLGQARDAVFEVTVSDPVAWSLINAWIDLEAGTH